MYGWQEFWHWFGMVIVLVLYKLGVVQVLTTLIHDKWWLWRKEVNRQFFRILSYPLQGSL